MKPDGTETKAVTVVEDPPHFWNPDVPQGGFWSGIAVIVGGLLYLRRKFWGDNKQISEDKKKIAANAKETTLLDRLEVELKETKENYARELGQVRENAARENSKLREVLDLVTEERNRLASQVGGLQATNHYLADDNDVKTRRIERLERRLKINIDSNLGELGEH